MSENFCDACVERHYGCSAVRCTECGEYYCGEIYYCCPECGWDGDVFQEVDSMKEDI